MTKDPFEEYLRQSEPNKRDLGNAWQTAVGLQAVDGLETSHYLIETAKKNIEGEISLEEANALINSYYAESAQHGPDRTEEADKVSARIAQLLAEKSFVFSPAQYLSIHKRLFTGIYKHAGQIRDYNITKKEWVLDGNTVIYGGASELRATLDYDFAMEKAFRYDGLSMNEIIAHLAAFVSRLWQIHVFGEGNTRTTAVFFIKYLRTLGFDVTSDTFAENAWYFRNSLVRANYNDLKLGVHETTEYLELFLRNLLLGERHELHNRYLHISKVIQKQDIGDAKQDIDGAFPYGNVLKAAGASAKTADHVRKMFAEYGFETIFGRSDVTELMSITASPASTLLKKLADMGVTEAVSGLGKGKYRFKPIS